MGTSLRYILLSDRMLMSRLGLALGSLLWGVLLLAPAQIFPTPEMVASGTGRMTYALMARIAPEWLWGVAFLVHAIFALYTIFTGVRNRVTLACDGFLGCLVWTTSTVACYVVYWPSGKSFLEALYTWPAPAAMSADIVLSFYAWWHMVRFWAAEEGYGSCTAHKAHKGA